MRVRIVVTIVALVVMAGSTVARAGDGAAVYKSKCATCHGETGHAESAAAKAMKAPALAGNAVVAGLSDADLVTKIKANKRHASIKSISDEDLAAAVTHTKSLAAGK